eukprot:jgi/Botrbrau1/6018/Bobra.0042s0004.1
MGRVRIIGVPWLGTRVPSRLTREDRTGETTRMSSVGSDRFKNLSEDDRSLLEGSLREGFEVTDLLEEDVDSMNPIAPTTEGSEGKRKKRPLSKEDIEQYVDALVQEKLEARQAEAQAPIQKPVQGGPPKRRTLSNFHTNLGAAHIPEEVQGSPPFWGAVGGPPGAPGKGKLDSRKVIPANRECYFCKQLGHEAWQCQLKREWLAAKAKAGGFQPPVFQPGYFPSAPQAPPVVAPVQGGLPPPQGGQGVIPGGKRARSLRRRIRHLINQLHGTGYPGRAGPGIILGTPSGGGGRGNNGGGGGEANVVVGIPILAARQLRRNVEPAEPELRSVKPRVAMDSGGRARPSGVTQQLDTSGAAGGPGEPPPPGCDL